MYFSLWKRKRSYDLGFGTFELWFFDVVVAIYSRRAWYSMKIINFIILIWMCALEIALQTIDWSSFEISRLLPIKSLLFSYFHSSWIKLSHLIEMSNVPRVRCSWFFEESGILNFRSSDSCVSLFLIWLWFSSITSILTAECCYSLCAFFESIVLWLGT